MKLHFDVEEYPITKGIITIGTFDGVHLGHQAVIKELTRKAKELNGESVIFTFYPHPRKIVSSDSSNLRILSSVSEKTKIIETLDVDHLVIYPFTPEFASMSYEEFVREILMKKLHMTHLVIGYDHRFGKGRSGNYTEVQQLSKKLGFTVESLQAMSIENITISSTKIRNAISEGKIDLANKMLGTPYSIYGKVIKGNQIGRTIDFPTANIQPEESHKLLPMTGVYAVRVEIGNRWFNGMMNIGYRPTIESNADHKSIEVNIFDFIGDIYGENINIQVVDHLRSEIKFSNKEELRKQLSQDRIDSLKILL